MNKIRAKYKILFGFFILILIGLICYGIFYFVNNINSESYSFQTDGYTIKLSSNMITPETYSFSSGEEYNYKKYNDNITFNSKEKGNVAINPNNMIHYQDGSLLTLKNMVGLDLNNIDNNIIFYYNIYKNTLINKKDGVYYINANQGNVNFEKLILRIDTNKFLVTSNDIKLLLSSEDVVEFNDYIYFEYTDGSVVKIYNNQKYYQTISSDAKIILDNISIDLSEETISKEGKKYITLTNLVLNSDGNIDVIVDNEKKSLNLATPNAEQPTANDNTNTGNNQINLLDDDNNESKEEDEEIVDEDKTEKTPVYKVVELNLTSLKLDARIEVTDEDSLIVSPTEVKIYENATYKVIYEDETLDSNIMISIANLSPDTEYTLTAKSTYKLDEVEYEKTFVSKIFRTEALGVSISKNYVAQDMISVNITKEAYSNVTSASVSILSENGNVIDTKTVNLNNKGDYEVNFYELDKNTTYTIVMSDILSEGVVVEDGYSQSISVMTLKEAPTIGKLNYVINKKNATFSMNVSGIKDPDSGIVSYRYEVYDARNSLADATPVATVGKKDLSDAIVNVDGSIIERGVPYTYKLIVEFNDNEKIIEYSRDLGKTMQLDGIEFPTLRFDETYVTWEQINGVIVIDDPSGALSSESIEVVYKNSVDIYDVMSITLGDTDQTMQIANDTRTMSVPAGTIPIVVNDLRANETYTFQVFGYVNLQDQNAELQKVYIGSVFVQTKEPQSLQAGFTEDKTDVTQAFNITISLGSMDGQDASLEASTLNEMKFTIYQGTNTSGAEAASVKIQDLNSEPYVSTIKRDYYDNTVTITPEFFSMKNTDFALNDYTLVISNAKDYTRYGNEIPIENNILNFTLNSYVSEFSGDPSDSVHINEILNKNAVAFGLNYDDNLDNNTIIGYNIAASYNNEAKNAMYLIYHVWVFDGVNNTWVMLPHLDKRVSFNTNGTLPSTIYEVDYGTEGLNPDTNTSDTKLRRGNKYYFTYEVYLDTTGSMITPNVIYPNDVEEDLTLRSVEISPKKQKTIITMYPSTSASTQATWKYKIKDVDYAMPEKNLYAYVGADISGPTSRYKSRPAVIYSNNFESVVFTGLTQNKSYGIKVPQRLIKSEDTIFTKLNEQWHYAVNTNLNLTYEVVADINKLSININDYWSKKDIADLIVNADVIITPINDNSVPVKTFNNVEFVDGTISIDYYDIADYINKDLNVTLVVYFDSGEYGFDIGTEYKALQKVSIEGPSNYYYISGASTLQRSTILGSKFITNLDTVNNTLSLNNGVRTNTYDVVIDSGGVIHQSNYVVTKAIRSSNLASTSSNVRFDSIVAGISLTTGNKVNISSLLNGAEIDATLYTTGASAILDNRVYIELFKTDQNGGNAEKVYENDLYYSVNAFNSPINIDGLTPETNYYVKFYVYVDDGSGNRVKTYLYDVDSHESGLAYRFYTLSSVGVKNISLVFNSKSSYTNKRLILQYGLDAIHGFDRIEYEVYIWNGSEYVPSELVFPTSTVFSPQMTLSLDASPGSIPNVHWGQKYKVVVKPIGTYESNGTIKEMDLGKEEAEITLSNYQEPYIGVSSGKTSNTIYFRVSVNDIDHLIVNDRYAVRLEDEDGNIITTIGNNSTNEVSKQFTFSSEDYNLIIGKKYTLYVVAELDKNNTGNSNEYSSLTRSKTIVFGDSVSLGSVSATQSSLGENYVDLIFADSYKLTDITNVSYFVSSASSGEFVISGSDAFSGGNLKYNSTNNYYYYTLNIPSSLLNSDEVYIITMNFYTESNLVEQEEVNYYYGG